MTEHYTPNTEAVSKQSRTYSMNRRLRRAQNPGAVILRAVRRRLIDMWYATDHTDAYMLAISTAICTVDLCISRVISTLEV